MKPSNGAGDDCGCSSADVASERVLCCVERDGRRCLLDSCVAAVMEPTFDVRRSCAGQSHGSVNWSESCVGERNASLRSLRVAARASIIIAVYGVLNVIKGTRTGGRYATRRNGNEVALVKLCWRRDSALSNVALESLEAKCSTSSLLH